ncbi:hypothetical protein TNCT_143481 [Trichonephila clavata]|uniref:Uncharacterized protein n=1 Tax=Trichonephila clavata TaxID=2740835 RepID=A0A8X6J1S9_TRICU|nr:hypothetical protein TNCT_143481 [Trichonephila clavata]
MMNIISMIDRLMLHEVIPSFGCHVLGLKLRQCIVFAHLSRRSKLLLMMFGIQLTVCLMSLPQDALLKGMLGTTIGHPGIDWFFR